MLTGSFESVSNRETWSQDIELTDGHTGAAINLTGAAIVVEIRAKRQSGDYGIPAGTVALSATTVNGKITLPGGGTDGVLRWTFSATDMRGVCAGTYDVGATYTLSGVTTQILIGTVPILDGIVS
jgi:hypothetical protein